MNNAWAALMAHAEAYKAKPISVAHAFCADANRFQQMSVQWGELLFDYSKQKVTPKTMELLFALAESAQLSDKIEALFSGERLNGSEGRSVLHTALRDSTSDPLWVDGQNIKPEVIAAQEKMQNFVTAFHTKQKKGVTGHPATALDTQFRGRLKSGFSLFYLGVTAPHRFRN